MKKWLKNNEKGQTATEYMLIIGVIVIGLLIAAQKFIPTFEEAVNTISKGVTDCVTTGECKFQGGSSN